MSLIMKFRIAFSKFDPVDSISRNDRGTVSSFIRSIRIAMKRAPRLVIEVSSGILTNSGSI